MKNLYFILACLPAIFTAQVNDHYNITKVGLISPNNTVSSVNKYSGCWGWYQASKNKEYAISGASNGTYFIDITSPSTPTVSAFLPSKSVCTWRELKTYSHYAYIVSDVCQPNAFQIVDLQYLPDSIHIVHNDTTHFTLGHTIWIDNDKMYVASTRFNPTASSPMTVWSLANPEVPVLLRRLEQDISSITEVHDMYVRNDTAYVSAGWLGLRVVKFNSATSTFSLMGSYSGYPEAGYNHSSALTQDGKHLIFCDEVGESKPIHFLNVQNPGNLQEIKNWHPRPRTTPHNPFVIGNKWAVVSTYQDGLFIYDISIPSAIKEVGYFDTFHQGGFNTGHDTVPPNYGSGAYNGNWGAYPYLPSKIIIANDMANGVFLLDATAAYNFTTTNTVGFDGFGNGSSITIYPNPASSEILISGTFRSKATMEIRDLAGRLFLQRQFEGEISESTNVSELAPGTYIISIVAATGISNKKIIITR